MKDTYIDCTNIPECDPINDDGCQEQLWTWKQYCSNRELFEQDAPDVETVTEAQPVHIPVDTSGNVGDALQCSGMLLGIFGVAFVIVGTACYIKDRITDNT